MPIFGELQVAEDIQFERRSWTAQRVAWIVGVLLLLAALLGFFGRGWLSHAEKSSPDGLLRVEYERFLRDEALAQLDLHIQAAARDAKGIARVRINRPLAESIEIRTITPEPIEQQAHAEGVVYAFRIGETGPAQISIVFEVRQLGSLPAEVSLVKADGSAAGSVAFRAFIYP